MIGGLIWKIFLSPAGAVDASTGAGTTSGRIGRTGWTTGSGIFANIGGRIFELGGSTDLILVSLADDSERFDRVSSISETDSGLGGGVSATGSIAGAGTGVAAGFFALLIGGTAD